MEEEDDAESLKELQENMKCFKVNGNILEAIFMFLTLLFFINYYISASVIAPRPQKQMIISKK